MASFYSSVIYFFLLNCIHSFFSFFYCIHLSKSLRTLLTICFQLLWPWRHLKMWCASSLPSLLSLVMILYISESTAELWRSLWVALLQLVWPITIANYPMNVFSCLPLHPFSCIFTSLCFLGLLITMSFRIVPKILVKPYCISSTLYMKIQIL